MNADARADTLGRFVFTNQGATFKDRVAVERDNAGGYAQYLISVPLLGKTNFGLGGRYDWNSVYGETVNPSVSLVNRPWENWAVKFLFGTAYRAPTSFELYSQASTRLPNPDLAPEKISAYEAQLLFAPNDSWLLQASLFRNDLEDLIVEGVPVGGGFFRNENVGHAQVQGVEAGMDVILSPAYSGFANLTLQDGERSEGKGDYSMPNIARRKANLGITWSPGDIFSAALIANWVGERYVQPTNPLGQVDGYWLTHLTATLRRFFWKQATLSLGIHNLFDQEYFDPGVRASDGVQFPTVQEQPGINGLAKLSIHLD